MDIKLKSILSSEDIDKLELLNNPVIEGSFLKADEIINNNKYSKILCSISGGADSDIVLDLCLKIDKQHKLQYIFVNTGLEYQATKDHIEFLKNKYSIDILTLFPDKPIPVAVKECGVPFINKLASRHIQCLQKHNFDWNYNVTYEELLNNYHRMKSTSKWWMGTNFNENKTTQYCIDNNKYLKEFLAKTPPIFKISNRCCDYVKKHPIYNFIKKNNIDISIVGLRKAEGGIRHTLSNCFDYNKTHNVNSFRPILWYTKSDKQDYEKTFNIIHSRCYTEYGLKRTGCVGCPFNRDYTEELVKIEKYEPKLYVACQNIFGKSYEYTQAYRDFAKEQKQKNKKT